MPKPKAQARSSRAVENVMAGQPSVFGGFGTATSPFSYLEGFPDPSSISNPQTIVIFKNLAKKDSTTKAKALEDLQNTLSDILSSKEELEDAIVTVWIGVYPKTSIDTSRRVRQLSHIVQKLVCLSAGKRVAKSLPQLIGPWLLGVYDSDKVVSNAAQEALFEVFNTAEKRSTLRKIYQQRLLKLCKVIIVEENPQTLSDERTLSLDESAAKYNRTVTAALGLFTEIIHSTLEDTKSSASREELISHPKFWAAANLSDSASRRAFHRLISGCVRDPKTSTLFTWSTLSSRYIEKGLESDQSSSAVAFLESLIQISKANASIWTTDWKGKKAAHIRLRHFILNGTQGGSAEYWTKLGVLFSLTPRECFPDSRQGVEKIFDAYHEGLTRKEEPKAFLVGGIMEMVLAAPRILSNLSAEDHQICISNLALPLVNSYLSRSEHSRWALSGSQSIAAITAVAKLDGAVSEIQQEWPVVSGKLVDSMKLSLPEAFGSFQSSQDSLASYGQRWSQISSIILHHTEESTVTEAILNVVREAMSICTSHVGKPYGVASIIHSVLTSCPSLFTEGALGRIALENFETDQLPEMFLSPSSKQFSMILGSSHSYPAFQTSWNKCLETVANAETSMGSTTALLQLLEALPKSGFQLSDASRSAILDVLQTSIGSALEEQGSWDLASTVLSFLKDEAVVDSIYEALSTQIIIPSAYTLQAISGFLRLFRSNPLELNAVLAGPKAEALVVHLLLLTESSNEELARAAGDLKAAIMATPEKGANFKTDQSSSIVNIIQQNLSDAGPATILVSTLVAEAISFLKTNGQETVGSLLPPINIWKMSIESIAGVRPWASMAISSPFRNGLFLIEQIIQNGINEMVKHDILGFSIALRQALYTVSLLKEVDHLAGIDPSTLSSMAHLLALTTVIANENLSIAGSNRLYSSEDSHTLLTVVDFVSESKHLLRSWLENYANSRADLGSKNLHKFIDHAIASLFDSAAQRTPISYHSALAYHLLASQFAELAEQPASDLSETIMSLRKSRQSPFSAMGFLSSYCIYLPESTVATRWYNEIVADFSGSSPNEETLGLLCIMYVMMNDAEAALISTTAPHRRLMFVKKIIGWLDLVLSEGSTSFPHICAALSVLSQMVGSLVDVYGDHWETIVSSCISILSLRIPQCQALGSNNDPTLSLLHETLQLYRSLISLSNKEHCNEDLSEALASSESAFYKALLNLVPLKRSAADESHQPLRIVNELIQRMLSQIPPSVGVVETDLYPVLSSASRSEALQLCAFNLLHSVIPKIQKTLSIQIVLEKKTLRLPDELVSLILEPPAFADNLEETSNAILLSLRGYFLSWVLVFDHFSNASHLLKDQYVDCLKDGDYLPALLNLISDILKLGTNRPVARSDLAVSFYEPNDSVEPLDQILNLANHLYYLSLLHLSSLSRSWFVDIRSRGLSQGVESWTEKYISSHVIEAIFKSVQKWAEIQRSDSSDDGKPLNIKAYIPLAEIIVSYSIGTVEVPDSTNVIVDTEYDVAICVKLPKAFPLRTVEVRSVTTRSTFEERRWNSWLRTCQGIISHKNDGVVDGILNWKRNVVGATQGKEDCAICYSLVAEDGKLPNKKCKTCKHTFHAWCLNKWFSSSGDKKCPLCRSDFGDVSSGRRRERE